MASEEKKSRFRTITKEKNKKNFILKAFLFFFIGGYALFFTSNIWYPSNADMIAPTEFNVEKNWNERQVSLLSWDYSKSQNMMEIQLEIENASLDGITSYSYEILDKKKGYFSIEPVIETSDLVVLHVKNIRNGWSELSLRLRMPGEEDNAENVLKFYTNAKAVNLVEQIEVKSENEYYAARIENRISVYEEQISQLQEEISVLKQQITTAESRIDELKEGEIYQTEQQKKETEETILQAQSDIQMMELDIEEKTADIEEYEERISMSELELENYK